jgi:hypothetical protein
MGERMPGISIVLNGRRIATIDLAGLQVVSVLVSGALDRDPKAVLDAHGGNYRAGGGRHRIWIAEHALLPGDRVTMAFDATADGADQGHTLAELFPDAVPATKTDGTVSAGQAAEMAARPQLHDAFIVDVATVQGQQARAASDAANTAFLLGLVWDDGRPDQARLRLGTYGVDDVPAKTGGTTHLKTMLALGERAVFSLVA